MDATGWGEDEWGGFKAGGAGCRCDARAVRLDGAASACAEPRPGDLDVTVFHARREGEHSGEAALAAVARVATTVWLRSSAFSALSATFLSFDVSNL